MTFELICHIIALTIRKYQNQEVTMPENKLLSPGFAIRENDPLFGLFGDNTESKGMSRDELVAYCKTKGVNLYPSTQSNSGNNRG